VLKPRPILHTAAGLALLANASSGQAATTNLPPAASPHQQSGLGHAGFLDQFAPRQTGLGEFTSHFDGVLGTSFDLVLHTLEPAVALHCQEQIFSEVERLRAILSTYDPAGEIRQVMTGAPVRSRELTEVLAAYDTWAGRSKGALNVNLAAVIAAWRAAEKSGVPPTSSELRAALQTPLALNVDALGKGYIIDRAVSIARRLVPAGLLDIGGDIRVWGDVDWPIGIADPRQPADNATPVATFMLREAAVATSGGYARYFTLAGQRFSHLISPLTLQPLHSLTAATVVAADCVTANALSSAACVLGAVEGSALAHVYAEAHVIWDAVANRLHSHKIAIAADAAPATSNLASHPPAAVTPTANPSPAAAASPAPAPTLAPWPKNYQVSINLDLGGAQTGRAKRPYVAIWIVNDKNVVVRTVDVWGRQPKYMRELSYWMNDASQFRSPALSLTRATRAPGKYNVVWDGKDDKGVPVPQGKYTVVLEINREHGNHAKQTVALACAAQPVGGVLKATAESGESPVHYGPAEVPAPATPAATAAPAK